MSKLPSSDLFVILPPLTSNGIIFGKNSNRPKGEVQEVVYAPPEGTIGPKKCTYIEVQSPDVTKAVILSKSNWTWGAEMGANESGVVIGNSAIFSNDTNIHVKRLLGVDLVRLGLERSSTADKALDVIVELLEKYGQGGPCSKTDNNLCYQNSFLIADADCVWVLETYGNHWVAEKITSGYRSISNSYSITTKFDRKSDGIEEFAKSNNLWNGNGDFNFSEIFSSNSNASGNRDELLAKYTASDKFKVSDMFSILRDNESGICRNQDDEFPTAGSQVSTLTSNKPNIHWFTATPDPSRSVFKPFIFSRTPLISKHTICPNEDAPHTLYSLHKEAEHKGVHDLLRNMEANCVDELSQLLPSVDGDLSEFDELLKDCVETEVKFYR